MFEDTKGVLRNRKSQDRQWYSNTWNDSTGILARTMFEDTKGVFRNRKSQDRQYNSERKRKTMNDKILHGNRRRTMNLIKK